MPGELSKKTPVPLAHDKDATRLLDLAQKRDARSLELIAEELRLAQQAFANITGKFSADDLLGEIFSRFCIGK